MTRATKPSRAVCYVRISVDRDDETSTKTQETRIRAYCKSQGWTIVDVIVEPGRSAYKNTRSNRPGFRRAMGLIESGAADVLVVWKIDRAARNTVDTLNLVEELAAHGAQFVSVTEQFDTSTATGEMTLTMLAGLARMESRTKAERTKAWHEHRHAAGRPPTGPRPFGYQRQRNKLVIDKAEAAVIRKAARQLLAGKSLRSIVRNLADTGVVGTRGTAISQRGLRKLLLSPTTAACRVLTVDKKGKPLTFSQSDEWKPILDRDTWDAVRALLEDPERRTNHSNGRRHLLAGIVRCGRCVDDAGSHRLMRSLPNRGGTRYSCPSCYLSIDAAQTEDVVQRDVLAMLDPKTWRRLRQGKPMTSQKDVADTEKALEALSAQFLVGDLDKAEFADLADALRRQHVVDVAPPPPLPDVADLAKAWPKFELAQRWLVIMAATESLTIAPWTPTGGTFDETRIEWVPA
jgi:DNA invertase Pin-like site-specific DNA recombinase